MGKKSLLFLPDSSPCWPARAHARMPLAPLMHSQRMKCPFLLPQRNKDRPTLEIGELEGEKVFLKYGKYGRCISCDGTVAMVSPQPDTHPAPTGRAAAVL